MRRARRRALLTAEILRAYLAVRRARAGQDLPETLRRVRAVDGRRRVPQPGTASSQPHEALRLARATAQVLARMPLDDRCLTTSLVTVRILARRDIPSRLVIGVRPGERLRAHAWVEVDDMPVLDPRRELYQPLADL